MGLRDPTSIRPRFLWYAGKRGSRTTRKCVVSLVMQERKKRLRAIHHMVHEYANFVSSAEMVLTGKDIDGMFFKSPINTHVSHAFYLNCRKLADFFQNRGRRRGDVLAEHFSPGFHTTLTVSNDWRDPIDKQLAHVTYARDEHSRELTASICEALYAELKQTWRDFRATLLEPYASEFARKIKERKAPDAKGTPSEFRGYDLD